MSYQETRDIAVRAKLAAYTSIRDRGHDAPALLESVASVVAGVFGERLASGPELLVAVIHTVVGAVHGVSEAGAAVGGEAAAIMSGVLRGARRVGRPTLETVNMLANMLVRTGAGVGGDPLAAALGAVDGGRACALDLDVPVDASAGAAAAGALRAAAEMNPLLADRIREAIGAGDGDEALHRSAPSRR